MCLLACCAFSHAVVLTLMACLQELLIGKRTVLAGAA